MKRRILWSLVITLFSAHLYAAASPTNEQNPNAAAPAAQTPAPAAQTPAPAAQTPAPEAQTPAPEAQTPAPEAQAPAPEAQAPAPEAQAPAPEAQTPAPEAQAAAPEAQAAAPQQPINCEYKITAETKTIDDALVLTWARNAAIQSFDFDHDNIDQQISALQACYTGEGWKGFNDALQKSGNLDAIKSQNLTVSSQVDGEPRLTDAKDNQWKVTLPLRVVYQNNQEKLTQLLTVNLLISRKTTGELGIMQLIATPRKNAAGDHSQGHGDNARPAADTQGSN